MEICQTSLPFTVWAHPATARLPGVQPAPLEEWLWVDEAYAAQMAHRARLIAEQPEDVIAQGAGTEDALEELLDTVLEVLPPLGFSVDAGSVTCPDGRCVPLDRTRILHTLGHTLQQDLCLHQKPPGASEHHLTAAVLCFPASWRLAEKIGRPLSQVHTPVDVYDTRMAQRVQRMFDAMPTDRLLWRGNALLYGDPELHQPRSAEHRRRPPGGEDRVWMRSERQVLRKLPRSGAVVFAIHTFVLPLEALTPEQRDSLAASEIGRHVLG